MSNLGTRWTYPVTARRVPSKLKGTEQGSKGRKKQRKCSCTYPSSSRVHNRMLAVIE
jgi:hypothetical protein